MLDIALEQKLDELDPLRHLRDNHDLDAEDRGDWDSIVPAQPPSILDQTIELTFPCSTSVNLEENHRSITIRLAVDASPGCGGIAWPAGEVHLPELPAGAAGKGLTFWCMRRFSRATFHGGAASEGRQSLS